MAADPTIADIMIWPGNFAPSGWAFCNGQILPISQHAALFALLGTTYGGDGRTTFALPDLRGRIPVGAQNTEQLETGGAEIVPLEQFSVQGNVDESPTLSAFDPNSAGVEVTMPYLSLNYVIALRGYFPTRG